MNPFSHLAISMIRLYQWCVSPWLRSSCRFEPSCSHYGVEAITHHGVVGGLFLTLKRVLRCHPFGNSGYDPVPPSKSQASYKR